jgi:hypothetical protein
MRIFALTLLLALATPPTLAVAQRSDSSRSAAARALFVEGVTLAHQGDYAQASERFRRSAALHPAGAVRFNLASALVHTGALVEASEILEGLLREPTITDPVRRASERLRGEIAPRLARVIVRLDGDASDVTVELDGESFSDAALGVAVPIDPGEHRLRVRRDDDAITDVGVTVAEGESREVVLAIPAREIPVAEVPVAAIAIAPPIAHHDEPVADVPHDDDAVWIGVGIGIAALVAGAAITTVVLVTTSESPMPVGGNTMPGVLTW